MLNYQQALLDSELQQHREKEAHYRFAMHACRWLADWRWPGIHDAGMLNIWQAHNGAVNILPRRTHLSGCEQSRSSPQQPPWQTPCEPPPAQQHPNQLLLQLRGLPAAGCLMATRLPPHLLSRLVRCSQGD